MDSFENQVISRNINGLDHSNSRYTRQLNIKKPSTSEPYPRKNRLKSYDFNTAS